MWQKANQWLLGDCKVEQHILQNWRWSKDIFIRCLSTRIRSQQNCTTMYAEDVLCAKGKWFHMERIYRRESRAPEIDLSNGQARTQRKLASAPLVPCTSLPSSPLTPRSSPAEKQGCLTLVMSFTGSLFTATRKTTTWRQWWPIWGKPTGWTPYPKLSWSPWLCTVHLTVLVARPARRSCLSYLFLRGLGNRTAMKSIPTFLPAQFLTATPTPVLAVSAGAQFLPPFPFSSSSLPSPMPLLTPSSSYPLLYFCFRRFVGFSVYQSWALYCIKWWFKILVSVLFYWYSFIEHFKDTYLIRIVISHHQLLPHFFLKSAKVIKVVRQTAEFVRRHSIQILALKKKKHLRMG